LAVGDYRPNEITAKCWLYVNSRKQYALTLYCSAGKLLTQ